MHYSLSFNFPNLELINNFRSSFDGGLTAVVVTRVTLLTFAELVQESLHSRNGERLGISGVLHTQDSSVASSDRSFIVPFTVLLVSDFQVFNSLEDFI